jgi:hypothetical protein
VPKLSGRELLNEWRRLVDSMVASAASAPGRSDLRRDLLAATQRQLELVAEIVEREREVAGHLVAPIDAVFDLLEETGATLRWQAEALETSASAWRTRRGW